MHIIGKIVLLPFAAAFSLAVAVLGFLRWLANAALYIICLLFLVAAFSLLVVDGDHGGCIRMLVMAFLISPFGLPLLADFALDSLSGACGSLWGYIRAL